MATRPATSANAKIDLAVQKILALPDSHFVPTSTMNTVAASAATMSRPSGEEFLPGTDSMAVPPSSVTTDETVVLPPELPEETLVSETGAAGGSLSPWLVLGGVALVGAGGYFVYSRYFRR